ncbi:hypothetical protein F3Y22_tig00111105pilonHSYRG00288 [Hibiscus syriacus]|uniref:Uncharacterized protein n=1 Tax=Hibiscus syriacus TaxID=106335 RepID=A0A6A2YYN4_HIBSY|nr:hypothetical protein F3Y22_tig00111105pilonHSYRG00288 [Hibiscus syriacus]
MATRRIILSIFILFLCPLSNAALYRTHDLSLVNNNDKAMNFNKASFSLLTKGVPIPPSGPSGRHNDHTDAHGSASAKDGLRV